jgi:hypothetical protein
MGKVEEAEIHATKAYTNAEGNLFRLITPRHQWHVE